MMISLESTESKTSWRRGQQF